MSSPRRLLPALAAATLAAAVLPASPFAPHAPRAAVAAAATSPTVSISCAAASAVNPGAVETFSARVGSNAYLANAIVSFEVYNAAGSKVYQTFVSPVSLAAATPHTVSGSWAVPAAQATGSYSVKVLVFGPNWTPLYASRYGCATFAVTTAPPTVTIACPSNGATPGTVYQGATETLSASVSATQALAEAIVSFEVYDAAGTKVYQTFVSPLALAANTPQAVAATWAVPAAQATGSYSVKVLVFGANWTPLYSARWACASFGVAASLAGRPISSPTAAPSATPIPPTATSTPVPPTATPTRTPAPPTATPTKTPVPPTATPTKTPVPPTATPTNTPSVSANVTVSIDRSTQAGVSHLDVGVTHEHYSVDSSGNATAVANGRALLSAAAAYENQHIYGWGATNPEPSPGQYDWSSLDWRMNMIKGLGGTPVITLCCAPDWMTSLGSNTSNYPNLPPTASHVADFAALATAVAKRYPWVTHFQVWNEMKGYWNSSINNWDYVAYTAMYNAVYDALKAVNPNIQVGGPYLVLDPNSGSINSNNLAVLKYWLANKHGADFLAVDHSIVPWSSNTVPAPSQIIAQTGQFESLENQLRGLTSLPIWWAEDYFDASLNRLSYADNTFQAATLASMTLHELKGGASVTLRWGPQGDNSEAYNGDQEALFSDTRVSGGGQPFPYYAAFKAFHDDFGPGTALYAATSSSPTVEVLASATHTLLINKTAAATTVAVNGSVVTLSPYQVDVL